MSYSKNDCVELTIEDIGVSGEGIGKSRRLYFVCEGYSNR